jgi:amino acid transporter
MIGICPVLYVGWKIGKRTKMYRAAEVDLVKNLDEIDEYERTYVPTPPR